MNIIQHIPPGRFKDERLDCVVRAAATAFEIPYAIVHARLKRLGRRERHKTKWRIETKLMHNLGGKVVKRSGTVQKFLAEFPKGRFVVRINGHSFAVIDGAIYDFGALVKPLNRVKKAWRVKNFMTTVTADCGRGELKTPSPAQENNSSLGNPNAMGTQMPS